GVRGRPGVSEKIADLDPQRADDGRELAAGEAAKEDAAIFGGGDAQAGLRVFVGRTPSHPARVGLRHPLEARQDFLDGHDSPRRAVPGFCPRSRAKPGTDAAPDNRLKSRPCGPSSPVYPLSPVSWGGVAARAVTRAPAVRDP